MAISVLVADPNLEFAESARQVLEGTGRYVVLVAKNGGEAITVAGSRPVRLAIVNAVLPDVGSPHVVRQLRMLCPGLAVIAIPSRTDTEDSDLMAVGIDEFLPRLVYLPDLPKIVDKVLLGNEAPALETLRGLEGLPPPAPPTEPALKLPSWLLNQERATDYLARLIAMSPAIAAVLTLGNRLWAAVGALTPAQFDELTLLVAGTSASSPGRGALARFVRLTGGSSQLQLYSTEVVGDVLLSMVFPAAVPFGQVRLLARDVAAALASIDPGGDVPAPEPVAPAAEDQVQRDDRSAVPALDLPRDWVPQEPIELKILPFLAPLDLASQTEVGPTAGGNGKTLTPPEPMKLPRDWLPRSALQITQLPFLLPPEAETPKPPLILHEAPSSIDDGSWIAYTIVLLPRMPDHQLAGSLGTDVARWTERFCLAWDWRMDRLDVKPGYLSLTISLPPEVAPASAARLLTDTLSGQISRAFPGISADMPSGQFWSRNHLLIAGSLPPDRLVGYLRRVRQARGLST